MSSRVRWQVLYSLSANLHPKIAPLVDYDAVESLLMRSSLSEQIWHLNMVAKVICTIMRNHHKYRFSKYTSTFQANLELKFKTTFT